MHYPSSLTEPLNERLNEIRNFCVNNDQTIATAESVTAGAIQFLLSTAEGAQEFFQGGITTYNNRQKARHLETAIAYADAVNGVSSALSAHMAKAVCPLFEAQIGVGITGFATRVPEASVYDLYAFISIVKNGTLLITETLTAQREGPEAQWEFATAAIRLLAAALTTTGS